MWGPSPQEKGDHQSLGVRKLHMGVSSFWPPYWDLAWLCGRALALCIELEALGTYPQHPGQARVHVPLHRL